MFNRTSALIRGVADNRASENLERARVGHASPDAARIRLDLDVDQRESSLVEDAASALVAELIVSVSERHGRDSHRSAGQHVEDPIEPVPIEDRPGGAVAREDEVRTDAEIARRVRVFVRVPRIGDLKKIGSCRDVDDVGAAAGLAGVDRGIPVGREDGFSDRAIPVVAECVIRRRDADRRGEEGSRGSQAQDREGEERSVPARSSLPVLTDYPVRRVVGGERYRLPRRAASRRVLPFGLDSAAMRRAISCSRRR